MIIPFLLKRHSVYKNSKPRMFMVVGDKEDESDPLIMEQLKLFMSS